MVVRNNAQRLMPSDVSSRVGFFDRFAGRASLFASRAPFFAFCVLLVVLWLVQGFITILLKGDPKFFLDAQFQLEINTTTTIVTFLLVALLQNSQTREYQATQHKLNALADALADMMERWSERFEDEEIREDVRELRLAVGLEDMESTTDNAKPGARDHSNGAHAGTGRNREEKL